MNSMIEFFSVEYIAYDWEIGVLGLVLCSSTVLRTLQDQYPLRLPYPIFNRKTLRL